MNSFLNTLAFSKIMKKYDKVFPLSKKIKTKKLYIVDSGVVVLRKKLYINKYVKMLKEKTVSKQTLLLFQGFGH